MQKHTKTKSRLSGPVRVDEDGKEFTVKIDGKGIDWFSPEIMQWIAQDDEFLAKYLAFKQVQNKS